MAILLLFIITSMAEYLSITTLMCCAFKLDYRRYFPQIMFVCISLTYVSYVMRENDLTLYTPITQLIVWIVYMWLLFRLPLIHAAIVTVTCSMAFVIIQGSIIFITMQVISSEIEPMTVTISVVSSATSISVFALAYFIRKRNLGFSFVEPKNAGAGHGHENKNGMVIFVIAISLVVFAVTYSLTLWLGSADTFLLTVVMLSVTLTALIYLSALREIRKYTRK